MASTISLTGDWLINIGNRMQTSGTGNLGTYATGGIAVSPEQVGLGTIQSLVVDPAGGYTFSYVASTGKVIAYYGSSAGTPAGTIAVTDGAVTVGGGSAPFTDTGLGLTANSNAGVLTKLAATTVVIPQATLGIAATTATFTGTPGGASAAGTEVANLTALAGITFNFRAIGY